MFADDCPVWLLHRSVGLEQSCRPLISWSGHKRLHAKDSFAAV
jgi:hypothetical protein